VIVYRLAKAAYAALDGEGARLFGGRWNSPGRPMIYAAASASLALLEVRVHLDLPVELIPNDYRLLSIEIPDDADREQLDVAPAEPADCLAAGDAFLADGRALVLQVPSVVVPQERNALINPRHPDMARVRLTGNEAFVLDPRLF
jgi:RES domain-containing protein